MGIRRASISARNSPSRQVQPTCRSKRARSIPAVRLATCRSVPPIWNAGRNCSRLIGPGSVIARALGFISSGRQCASPRQHRDSSGRSRAPRRPSGRAGGEAPRSSADTWCSRESRADPAGSGRRLAPPRQPLPGRTATQAGTGGPQLAEENRQHGSAAKGVDHDSSVLMPRIRIGPSKISRSVKPLARNQRETSGYWRCHW